MFPALTIILDQSRFLQLVVMALIPASAPSVA
jgi:hypothetical protein